MLATGVMASTAGSPIVERSMMKVWTSCLGGERLVSFRFIRVGPWSLPFEALLLNLQLLWSFPLLVISFRSSNLCRTRRRSTMADYQMRSHGGKEAYEDVGGPLSPDDGILADEAVRKDAAGVVTGTEADALDMKRLGRAQELRRNFKSLSVLGLATTTMSTWVAMLLTSTFSLINGGLAGTIWLYLATWICTFSLAASLAEMASMAVCRSAMDTTCLKCNADLCLSL